VSVGGDEATYIILSYSLEHGRYHDEFLQGTPPHGKYPPGTAVWIALIRQIAGPNPDAVRAANILLLALTALLLGDAVRRRTGPWPGVAGVALTAFSAPLLELSGTALSEVPYTFLVIASLWATLLADKDGRGRWTAAALAAALASFLTRTAGITVVAGVVAWMLLRRRWTHALWSLLLSGAVIGGWLAYTARAGSANGLGSTYADDLRRVASTGPGGATGLLIQFTKNAKRYFLSLPSSLGVPTLPGTVVDNLIWLVVLGVSGTVGLVVLLGRWPAAAVHLLLSAGVLLVFPWAFERLLAPLLPLIAGALLTGSFVAARAAGRRAQVILPLALAVPLSIHGLLAYVGQDTNHECARQNPYADSRCFSLSDRGLVAAARMIRDSTAPGAVIATTKPATVFYFSGRLTVPLSAVLRSERERGLLDLRSKGVDWILLSNLQTRDRRTWTQLLDRHCESLELRARFSPGTLLLSQRAPLGSGENACLALKQFLQEPPG
jgi:dolichyl-phosphate-mannose-protein mannosyltransferase